MIAIKVGRKKKSGLWSVRKRCYTIRILHVQIDSSLGQDSDRLFRDKTTW